MSSSRQSGSGSNHQNNRPGSRSSLDETQPWPHLPPLRAIPPLRGIATPGDREEDSPPASATVASVSSRSNSHQRLPYMSTNASIRAERIRSLQGLNETSHQVGSSARDRLQRLQELDDTSLNPQGHPAWPYLQRARERYSASNSNNTVDDFDRSLGDLDAANTRLLSILAATHPPSPRHSALNSGTSDTSAMLTGYPPVLPHPHPLHDDSNRRTKRRKLDAEKQPSNFKGFRYGKYGQLEPGQLQMEMVSCDGGMFSNRAAYSADNTLKDDNSVYCTKGNRCNIILRHQGATAFTIQELVIKAPASMNFSHPVREGMVFITMEQDDTLKRTARYQVQYAPEPNDTRPPTCPHAPANEDENDEDLPMFSHHAFDRELRRVINGRRQRTGGSGTRYHYPGLDSDDEDPVASTVFHADFASSRRASQRRNTTASTRRRHPNMPSEFSSNHPDFRITTECSDDEEDPSSNGPGGPPFRRSFHPPNRIGSLPFETADSDMENDEDPLLLNTSAGMITRNPDSPSDSLVQAWEAHARATQEAVRAVGGGHLLVPHARFFIEERKSKCTIRFDPPVSGRFILLKMWSSHHELDGNIDIQSVIAKGFAGPRYFPSVELR